VGREPPIVTGRVPPNDLQAEAAVLSACLSSADARDEVADLLKADHFYSDANGIIFKAALGQHESGSEVDAVTVAAELRELGLIQRAGCSQYIGQLIGDTPAVANVAAHAQVVFSRWRRRRVIAEAQWIAAHGYETSHRDDDFADVAEARMTQAFGSEESVVEPEPLQETLKGVFEALSTKKSDAVATGFYDLDRKLGGGLYPGGLYIIAARPGMGKTAMADGVEVAIAKDGPWVVSFSVEMPKAQRAIRKVCSEARVDLQRFSNRELSDEDFSRLATAGASLAALPIHCDETADCTLTHIASASRRLARKAKKAGSRLGAIFVDYLQIMSMRRGERRDLDLAEVTRGLKVLAKQLSVPVVALSQLNRGVETRGKDKRPMLADLRESGAIEQDADVVMFLYRDEYYNRDTTQVRGMAEVIISKQRNGPTGCVMLRFIDHCARFENLAAGEYSEEGDW